MSGDVDIDAVVTGLERMIAEEMHLLGSELQDALEDGQSARLERLSGALDRANALLNEHRAVLYGNRGRAEG